MTSDASTLNDGMSHLKCSVGANAPAGWGAINPGASAGRMPANVLLKDQARVTAGLVKDADAVNQ
jgi:hypothetical protein